MKNVAAFTAFLIVAAVVFSAQVSAQSAPVPNPVISRDVPAYSGSGNASAGNDAYYYTLWNAQCPDYLAYDLSGVPEEKRQVIDAVWYCISSYDVVGQYVSRNMEPSDYTIEVNAAPGGTYPENDWKIVETVTIPLLPVSTLLIFPVTTGYESASLRRMTRRTVLSLSILIFTMYRRVSVTAGCFWATASLPAV